MNILIWLAGITIIILLCIRDKHKNDIEQFKRDNDPYNTIKRNEEYRIK